MAGPTTAPKPPGPRPPGPPPTNGGMKTATIPTQRAGISRGLQVAAHKIVVYGPGGCGKSSLAASLARVGIEPLFLDLESGTKFLDVARMEPQSWDELRAALHDQDLLRSSFGAVVIDSGTKAEEMAMEWMLANVKHEKGHTCQSIEDYGYGKGYVHLYETFMLMLGDLDAVARSGRHIVMICHDCTETVPNPASDDYIRYAPRLQSPASGKFSIRNRVREWTDHTLAIMFDVAIANDGKAKGTGTRAIYCQERPTHVAKSRTLSDTIIYTKDSPTLWQALFNKE